MDKLIEALNEIKDECKKYTSCGCNKCPLGDDYGNCMLAGKEPKHWVITEPTSIIRVMRW